MASSPGQQIPLSAELSVMRNMAEIEAWWFETTGPHTLVKMSLKTALTPPSWPSFFIALGALLNH